MSSPSNHTAGFRSGGSDCVRSTAAAEVIQLITVWAAGLFLAEYVQKYKIICHNTNMYSFEKCSGHFWSTGLCICVIHNNCNDFVVTNSLSLPF